MGKVEKDCRKAAPKEELVGKTSESKTGRLLLYMLGLVLTFNLGRDITLITLYPFLFGYVMLTVWAQVNGEK